MKARKNGKKLVVRIAKSCLSLVLGAAVMVGSVGCDEKQLMDLARDLISGSLQGGGGGQPPSLTPPGGDPTDFELPETGWEDDWETGDSYDCGCF